MSRLVICSVALAALAPLAAGRAGDEKKGGDVEEARAVLLRLTNKLREENARKPLKVNATLARAAQKHAENMARQDKYGDDGTNGHILDGRSYADRAEREGYPGGYVQENVGRANGKDGPALAEVMIGFWQKSPGHRAAMLSARADEIGVGAASSASGKWYFCEVVGSRQTKPSKFRCTLANFTKASVRLQVAGGATSLIGAGSVHTYNSKRDVPPGKGLLAQLTPAKGKAVRITLENRAVYRITGDETDLRVEKASTPPQ